MSGAQGEGGDIQKTGPTDDGERTNQTTPDIWAEVRALRDMVVELRVEHRSMELKVKESESQVNQLKAELIVTKVHMELLQKENSAQTTRLKSFETRLMTAENKTSDLEKENADLQTKMSNSERELLALKSRIDQLEKENAEKPKVAFYTSLTHAGKVGPYNIDIPLKYSKVFTNVGNAYSSASGFFRAPVKGVYYFHFTLSCTEGVMGVYVYKNTERIMSNWEANKNESMEFLSNSVVLELLAGDQIHLVLPKTFMLFDDGNNYSTFSGALLFTL